MNRIIDRLAQFLASPPSPALGLANIGSRQPGSSGDLPALAITLRVDDVKGNGLGKFVRQGHTPVQSTSLITVVEGAEAFLPGRRILRVAPLPLVRNPASTNRSFSGTDIQVRNLTTPGSPLVYQFSTHPTRADQFSVSPARGELVFGQAQTPGDQLELVHWTLTWREDIRSDRYTGLITLEAWASSDSERTAVVERTLAKLREQQDGLRQNGFHRFLPAGLGAATHTRWEPAVGSPMPVFRQVMEFRFTAEVEQGGEISSGGVIQRIDVAMDEPVDEQFFVP